MPIWRRIPFRSTPGPVMRVPSRNISPEFGSSSRLQQRSIVDLPDPEGPRTNTSSLRVTCKSIPLSIWSDPKDLCSETNSSAEFTGACSGVYELQSVVVIVKAALSCRQIHGRLQYSHQNPAHQNP